MPLQGRQSDLWDRKQGANIFLKRTKIFKGFLGGVLVVPTGVLQLFISLAIK